MDAAGGGKNASRFGVGIRSFSFAGPIAVGFGFGLSLVMLLQGFTVLSSWTSVYGSRGEFTVEACSIEVGPIVRTLECEGLLEPEAGSQSWPVTLVGSQAAFGSTTPVAGSVIEAYYRSGDTTWAYPVDGRTTVLARILIGIVPNLFLVSGTALWLAGSLLTRDVIHDEAEVARFRHWFPQRFELQGRGTTWIVVGLLWWLFDRFVVDQFLGAAPIT